MIFPQRDIAAADAALIEDENDLCAGSIAFDRPATDAEAMYLDMVEPAPTLAFHAIGVGSLVSLYVVRANPQYKEQGYFEKTRGLLEMCRSRQRCTQEAEALALVLTISGKGPDCMPAMRVSIGQGGIGAIFSWAPRRLLLLPQFMDVPPTIYEEQSPGRCMYGLAVKSIIHVDHVMAIGASYLEEFGIDDLNRLIRPVTAPSFET